MRNATIFSLFILLLGWSFIQAQRDGSRGASNDYLSPELRERVERLKRDAGSRTESLDELRERLETLWAWGNALALRGDPIPIDFPTAVSRSHRVVNGQDAAGIEIAPRAVGRYIGVFAREFQVKDEMPGALGELTLSTSGPVEADSFVSLTETYTVGEMPIDIGGGIALGSRLTGLQTEDASKAGYVTVATSNPKALLRRAEAWGQWRGIYIDQGSIAFRLEGEPLRKGDTVSVTFGDRTGGSPGYQIQSYSNDALLFPVYLDLEGEGVLFTPRWPAIEVTGRPETRYVNAVAPSIVKSGETFSLAVRSEDRWKNPTSGKTPEYEITLNGEPFRKLSGGEEAVSVIDGIQIEEPGVYRFGIRSADGKVEGRGNPVWVRRDPTYRVFWGDTHGHTAYAEGQGTPDGYFRFGRDFARLDFLTLSEHDIWMDDAEWRTLTAKVNEYSDPGRFTTILGYEWTDRNPIGGHHNVYFATPDGRRRVPLQQVGDLDELYAGLRKIHKPEEVLIIPHAHQAGDWSKNDAEMERLTEITSGHGTFEFFGNKYLQSGFEVGFIGSSDNHVGHPGYSGIQNQQLGGLAAVIADENTPSAIFGALKARSAYATTGERILIDVSLNGERMGRRLSGSKDRKIVCRVMGTEPIDSVDLIKNGEVIYSRRYLESPLESRQWLQLSFESSTEVFSRANPRGARPWSGAVEVNNARLVKWREPWFANPSSSDWQAARSAENKLEFQMNTRGRPNSMLLELDGASTATEITVRLGPARERAGSPGADDRPQERLPAEEIAFKLGELREGKGRREFRVVKNVDSIELQLVPGDGALDQEFEYVDQSEAKPGDYYYVRVRQIDGGLAWSSPFWVGR